jgi:hypothetical protein
VCVLFDFAFLGRGVDAQSDAPSDAATDADAGGCVVQTCTGTVSLYLGQTIPRGDICNAETCSWQGGGGFSTCGCSFVVDCPCPDAGPD